MRLDGRRALRLRMRDLAAASAFAAVALSGALPIVVPALFALALLLSLLGKRPFTGQPVASVIALLIAAVGLFGLAFRGQLDLVVSAVSFATLVTAQRMLSDPSPSTDQQVLLAGLLLMAGAAALSGDLWYAICLLLFGVFACLSLGLMVIEGPVERDEELPLRPVLSQVSVGVALALAGGVAFFVLFPRLSWNVASRRTGAGLLGGTTGMTDRVRLGGTGDLKTVARVVFRARLEPSPRTEQLERYWVGRRFDRFDGKEWTGTGEPATPRSRVRFGVPTGAVERIELLPAYESRTLISLEHAALLGPAQAMGPTGQLPVDLIRVGDEEVRFAEEAPGYQYVGQLLGDVPLLEADEAALRKYLELPDLNPEVRALAARIAGGVSDPEDKAQRLERWLRSNLSYTLELGGNVDDPLADFLFNRKAGHCEHFATALAVMLRTEGVPSRVVGGFFGGELFGDRYLVRAGDAHAWVEAYLPGRGWTRFDATPDDGRAAQRRGVWRAVVDAYEQLQELWRTKVVDYAFIDQWNFVRDLIRPPAGARTSTGPEPERATAERGERSPRAVFAALLGGALVFALLLRLTRRGPARHPASSFRAQLERAMTEAGVHTEPGEDLEALAARLAREAHPLGGAVQRATRRYLEARFGDRPISPEEQRALLRPVRSPPGR